MTTSPFLGLRLPELEDYYSLDGHWNYNSLLLDEFLANVNAAIVQLGETAAGKQDALTTAQLAAANSGVTAAKIAQYDAALAELIDNGPKNIMPISNPLTSETKRGITATYDFDAGTVTLNGEHDGTGDALFYLYTGNAADQKIIPAGSYHLSGCPAGGSTDTYCLLVQSVGGSPAYKLDTGSGQDFTIAIDGRMAPLIRVKKPAGQTVSFDSVIFKPMICAEAAWKVSQKFVPYAPTNAELYAMIQGGAT